MTDAVAPRLRAVLGFSILVLNLIVGLLMLNAPTLTVPIPLASMSPESGHNTIAAVTVVPPFPYVFAFAGASDREGSPASLTEDGAPLGPSHSLHSDIRAEGRGHFSLWSGAVYFSSSDNTDPRANGRIYRLIAQTRLPYRVTLGLAGLDLLCLSVSWQTVLRWLKRRGLAIAAVAAALAALRILLTIAGWMPPLFDRSATAIDGTMALAIAGHLLLGFGLVCAVYAAGLGALLWVERGGRGLPDLLLRAFLPGTLVLAGAALLAVAAPGGYALAAAVWLIAAAPLARYRPAPGEVRRALAPALFCAPAVALYAVILSFRFHGPSATLAGAPHGDETIYVGWAADLMRHVAPVPNLAVEGFSTPYGNLLPSLMTAPLLAARWFDAYLFFSASLPVLSLLALCLTAPICVRERWSPDSGPRRVVDILAVAGLAAAAFRYPSVLVESPVFAFLLPIIISTLYLATWDCDGHTRPWQALVTATLGTAVSKLVALPVLALVPAPDIAGRLLRQTSRRQVAVAVVFAVLVLAFVALTLRTYLPLFLQLGGLGPPSWEAVVHYDVNDPLAVACVVARDVGAVVLAAAWIGSRSTGIKIGVWAGVGFGFLMPFLFHTSLTAAVLLTALAVAVGISPAGLARRWLAAAAALMLPQAMLAEYGGFAVTLAWFAIVACLTLAMIRPEAFDAQPVRALSRMATATALFSFVLLWSAGAGAVRVGPETMPFTPDMRDIWRAVRHDTPSNALLFTDQTGDTESRLGGWDDFALAAQRQFYIVSWANALRSDLDGRRTRLDRNSAVLSGTLNPEMLTLSRRYDGFYAVLDARKTAPPGFVPVYRNASFALYRMAARSGGRNEP